MTRRELVNRLNQILSTASHPDVENTGVCISVRYQIDEIMSDLRADPLDMPEFVIKGKDALAVPTIREYMRQCVEHGLGQQSFHVGNAIAEIIHWQDKNTDATKLPDHQHQPVRNKYK